MTSISKLDLDEVKLNQQTCRISRSQLVCYKLQTKYPDTQAESQANTTDRLLILQSN